MNLKRHVVLAVAFLMVVTTGSLFAQTTGTLIGNVTTEGVPLPGVTVTVSSPQLQGTRTAVTDVNGNYKIGALPPGPYAVVFELEGMRAVTRNVNVNVASTARADAAMLLSAVAEAITVTATAPAVLETTEIQTNLSEDLVEALPMGRTILATVNLAPGVNTDGSVSAGGAPIISGAPSYDTVYYVDGAVVNENLRGAPQSLFIEDAIQETTVLTGGISAEFGRFTGGVVNTITKSGGNEFEGSFRDSFTDPSWREEYPILDEVPDSELNEVYEATLGGYVVRDRLWFFTAGRYFDTSEPRSFARSSRTYMYNEEETRLEAKLTGQITPNHSLVGTWFDKDNPQNNYAFGTPAEDSIIIDREIPEEFYSINYSGILSSNLLIEGIFADKSLQFVGSGGPPGDFVCCSNIYLTRWGARAGAPTFGNQGGTKERASENLTLKGTYYLSTANLGTHNIVAGYDDFSDQTTENNNQSGSDFTVYNYDLPRYNEAGELELTMRQYNAWIIWWPVLQDSQGSDFQTQSFFVNDKWDLNSRLSFNLGARYDKNDGQDQSGATIASDSKISPRLAGTYDLFGDGRVRVTGTWAQYVSKIAGGNVGDNTSAAASPSQLYWLYAGPTIPYTSSRDMLAQIWDWFQSVGGTENRDWLYGGGTNGIATQVLGTLESPSVNEWTIGVGTQVGPRGFVRVDYQNRDWEDFYVTQLTMDNPIAEDPLIGGDVQVELTTNSNDVYREYEAILLQGGYRFTDRLNLGANYTWSELTGNYEGEGTSTGPVTESGQQYQPELLNYAQRDPVGILNGDRTHKLDAWISYDLPTPVGTFGFSVLQAFRSGEPYEAAGSIVLDPEELNDNDELICPQCRSNPGYQFPATGGTYYFEERGAHRLDEWTRTDFALNYAVPVGPVELFVQGEVFNIFNEDAVIDIDETILTAGDAGCVQADGSLCLGFDPFTETPVKGVHWVEGPNYGQPVNKFDYQSPREWRFSAGFRF